MFKHCKLWETWIHIVTFVHTNNTDVLIYNQIIQMVSDFGRDTLNEYLAIHSFGSTLDQQSILNEYILFTSKSHFGTPLVPFTILYLTGQRGRFWKIFLWFRHIGYDLWGILGYVWKWLCRQVRQRIADHVDGGTSNNVKHEQLGTKDPHRHRHEWNNLFY